MARRVWKALSFIPTRVFIFLKQPPGGRCVDFLRCQNKIHAAVFKISAYQTAASQMLVSWRERQPLLHLTPAYVWR